MQFAKHVSKYTGLLVKEINDLNADTFDAETVFKLGLVNSIKTNQEFAQTLRCC